jgi:putative transposase
MLAGTIMARQARIVVPGAPHHVTQRGNSRQTVFFRDDGYLAYLDLARECFAEGSAQVWGYCLMPNHVHLIVTPSTVDDLRAPLARLHARYARHINRRERWTGCLWQARFASFPMDDAYFLRASRYVGLNPVRAGLVARAVNWPWSSVRSHLGLASDHLTRTAPLRDRVRQALPTFFDCDVEAEALGKLRRACALGQPLGAAEWIRSLSRLGSRPIPENRPRGRPRRDSSARSPSFAPAA